MKNSVLFFTVLFIITTSLCQAQNPTLWGMTPQGGVNNLGTIFSYNSQTGIETKRHDFGTGNDGQNPHGSLIQANNGLLYGMTQDGGNNGGGGTIFSYNVSTGIETGLYSFSGNSPWQNPTGSLLQANNGLLYGMTYSEIFSYDISTGIFSDLYNLFGSLGLEEGCGSFIQSSNGLLYGMTTGGGLNNEGTIFSYNITTGTATILHSFGNGNDGSQPFGSLIQASNGLLYGMTKLGGAYNVNNGGSGTVFNYDISINTYTKLWDFGNGKDGQNPYGSLLQVGDSLLWGMTNSGGYYDLGRIFSFRITFNPHETDSLYDFQGYGENDGSYPQGTLIKANNGLLYGMTDDGGTVAYYPNTNLGTIFSLDITKANDSAYEPTSVTETDIYNFGVPYDYIGSGADGEHPLGDLLEVDTPATGISQLSLYNYNVSIYPNPTSGQFTINLNGNQNDNTMEVYNMLGYKIFTTKLKSGKAQIDLSQCASGFYLYRVTDERDNLIGIGKIVIE